MSTNEMLPRLGMAWLFLVTVCLAGWFISERISQLAIGIITLIFVGYVVVAATMLILSIFPLNGGNDAEK